MKGESVFTLPNVLTVARLAVAVAIFAILPWRTAGAYLVGFFLFAFATATDWLDGFIARRFGWTTVLGRMLDPFVDKIVICGTFIYLVAEPRMTQHPEALQPWMVVVVLGREMLVTALRSFVEERGADFSAKWSGKLKMVFQCLVGYLGLLYLSFVGQPAGEPQWIYWPMVFAVWSMLVITVYSGVVYVQGAYRLLTAASSGG